MNPFNNVQAHMSDEKLAELEEKFGYKPKRPSASQPNEEPQAKRTAKGKSLTSSQSTQIKVPGTTSAMRTRPNNPSRDRKGFRQISAYQANKTAQRSTTVRRVDPEQLERPSETEIKDRILNPNNKHHHHNPPIVGGRPVE